MPRKRSKSQEMFLKLGRGLVIMNCVIPEWRSRCEITFYKSFGNDNAVVFTDTDLIKPEEYAASKNY